MLLDMSNCFESSYILSPSSLRLPGESNKYKKSSPESFLRPTHLLNQFSRCLWRKTNFPSRFSQIYGQIVGGVGFSLAALSKYWLARSDRAINSCSAHYSCGSPPAAGSNSREALFSRQRFACCVFSRALWSTQPPK